MASPWGLQGDKGLAVWGPNLGLFAAELSCRTSKQVAGHSGLKTGD